jgi:hypothetical protein
MSAFERAAAAIAADANMGTDATHTPAAGGSTTTLRVVLSAPDSMLQPAEAAMIGADAMLHVTKAALSSVAERDTFTIGGTAWSVMAALEDAERVTWRLPVRRHETATAGSTAIGAGL